MRFEQPTELDQALALLTACPDMTVLAGGTDVVVHRRAGKIHPAGLLDITRIPQLREINREGERISVGAAVTCAEIERSEVLQAACPLLCAAAASVGSPQIRSRATVGGNVANASPAADLIPALTALDAKAVLCGGEGSRRMPVSELVLGASRNGLRPGELMTAFEVPILNGAACWSFDKIGRRNALAIARLNGACVFTLREGRMEQVRLCIGAATDRPLRFREAEQFLEGGEASDQRFSQAGELVEQEILAQTGMRASSAYKLPVSAAFTARLLRRAWKGERA